MPIEHGQNGAPTGITAGIASALGAEGEGEPTLRLEAIAGPPMEPLVLDGPDAVTVGRSEDCEVRLADASVSRLHASIERMGGRWLITDRGSRHGVTLNAAPIAPETAVPLAPGDLIRIGPWTFVCRVSGDAGGSLSRAAGVTTIVTSDDESAASDRIESVEDDASRGAAQHRLDLLIECAAEIYAAEDERALAARVAEAAVRGTGFARAAVLRAVDPSDRVAAHSVGVLALHHRDDDGGGNTATLRVSRSLFRAASQGRAVRRRDASSPDRAPGTKVHSGTAGTGHAAAAAELCLPITLDGQVSHFLYLDRGDADSPDGETSIHATSALTGDAASFCLALARLQALAMASLRAEDVTRRNLVLEEQISAAREAQQLIIPPSTGVVGGLKYSLIMRPGLIVAGDLFDIIELAPGRVAVFLGDVTGEGIGAGIMMASAQAHLHAQLISTGCPAQAVNATNDYLAEHSPPNRFVSLWVGLFDQDAGTVEYVDAGHGHFLVVGERGLPKSLRGGGGIPAAIEPNIGYTSKTVPFTPSDRIVLFSDGVVEQTGGEDGRQLGIDEVIQTLVGSGSVERDAQMLLAAVLFHSGREQLNDDTTIASVQWSC